MYRCLVLGIVLLLAGSGPSLAPHMAGLADLPAAVSSPLEQAAAALGAGDGPAEGHPLACSPIGALSLGCGSPSLGGSPAGGSAGWATLCARDSCPPPGRGGAGLTYDPIMGAVVLFGGIDNLTTAANTTFSDTWIFRDGNWTQLAIPGPTARLGEYMAYDYSDHYIVMFGGGPYLTLNSTLYYNDTWTFQNGSWTQLHPAVSPDARGLGGMAYDFADGYLLMYGGMTSQYDVHDDTWTFHHGQWTNLTLSVHPPPLLSPDLAYDPAAGYVLLYSGATPSSELEFGDDVEQTWSFAHGAWTNLTPQISGQLPDGRILSSMAYDPAQGYMVLFGGWNTTQNLIFGDTWIFEDGFWSQLFLSPSPASAIIGASLISTTPAAGLFLFGGIVGTETSYRSTNATWSFGPPPANTTATVPPPQPAVLTLATAPSSCAQVNFNGTLRATSTPLDVLPGDYPILAPACANYVFGGWFTEGGATVAQTDSSSSTVAVAGNATLTAYYRPAQPASVAISPQPLDLAAAVVGVAAVPFVVAWIVRARRPPLNPGGAAEGSRPPGP